MLFAALALQPQQFDPLFRLLIFNSSALIAHYYTLARGRFIDFWFVLTLVLLVALGVFNNILAWNPSLSFL